MDKQVAELMAAVARVEVGVKSINRQLSDLRERSREQLSNHTRRVDSLEETRDRQRGAAKVLAGIVVLASSLATYFAFWS